MSANTYADEEVDDIIEFFYLVIKLIVAWLKKVPSLMERCFRDLKLEADIALVDEEAALVSCCCELMGLMHRFLCGCHRCLRFYIHYDRPPVKFEKSITRDYSDIDFPSRRTPPDQDYDIDQVRENV
jgi:hypothetical protein